MIVKPFFPFFGGKWRAAPHYPPPTCKRVIEPFAGSAGYSLRYYERHVTLYDVDPILYGVWDYLIHVKEAEILRLPVEITSVDDLTAPQEAKWLIGFWLNAAVTSPCRVPSAWMRKRLRTNPNTQSYWSAAIQQRIASQLQFIRHWQVAQGSYDSAPDVKATWFIDPPYVKAGKAYKHHDIKYDLLATWCRQRAGQVVVCESDGADWLPFQPFRTIRAARNKYSSEVIWLN